MPHETRGLLRQELSAAEAVVQAAMQRPDRCIHLLRPGRLVRVRAGTVDWGWGVVVSVLHTPPRAEGALAGTPLSQCACAAIITGVNVAS